MKKTLLAIVITTSALGTNAATVYDKDGTTASLDLLKTYKDI